MLAPNLYEPVPGDQGARGLFSDQSRDSSPAVWAVQNRGTVAAVGVALGAVSAALVVGLLKKR